MKLTSIDGCYPKISDKSSYINRAVSQCAILTKSELFSNIATLIFDYGFDNASITERKAAMILAAEHGVKITDEAKIKLQAKLKATVIDPHKGGYYQAVKLLTPLTDEEYQLAIEWLAEDKIRKDDIKYIFPELYHYLLPLSINSLDAKSQWITEYFNVYRQSKIKNSYLKEISEYISEKNSNPVSFQCWIDDFKTVKTILHNRNDIDVIYWIDGLGIDWIPLIRYIVNKYSKENIYLNEIHIGVAELPTSTSNNKEKLLSLLPVGSQLPKIGDLDSFAHSSKNYPQYIIDEIRILEKSICKVLNEYNGKKIAFVSDHGLTYLSQYRPGLKLAGIKSDHEGRFAIMTSDNFSKDNNYVILEDGKTVCSLSHQSLTDKVSAGHGAHGGCTPEEILVPVIIVSSQKNANTFSVKIEADEIDGTNPVLRFIIKGINSIDIPTLNYNGVTYQLFNIGGDRYESERLTLVETATKAIVCINDTAVNSFNIKVSTGATEDDLFDF